MIESLNGTRETVFYEKNIGMRLYRNVEDESYPIHWHTATEIIMPVVNHYTVEVGGKRYHLNPYDIIVLPSGELHELFAPPEGERIILQFDFTRLYNLTGLDSTFHLYSCLLVTENSNQNIHGELKKLIINITNEYFYNDILKEASILSDLSKFFVLLGRNCIDGIKRFPNANNQKYHEYTDKFIFVCNYINEHCTEDLDVDELASFAGFSKSHFTRLFKRFTGITYYDYLNRHKIMVAEKLLIEPKILVTDVAMQSGFLSLSTFNRVFKSYKKCTPTEFRNLHNKSMGKNLN